MKNKITFTEFLEIESKLEIRMGLVVSAIRIPKKDKLLQLTVRFGIKSDESQLKTVVTNLGETYEPEAFEGTFLPFITNLEPSKIGGVVSEAMIMVGKPTLEGYEDIEVFDHDYSVGTRLL